MRQDKIMLTASPRRHARQVLIATLVLVTGLFAMLLTAPHASASIGFKLAGVLTPPPQGFQSPHGVAVNNTAGLYAGDVYVSDLTNGGTISKFSPTGVWESSVTLEGGPVEITVDNNPGLLEGDLYVVTQSTGVVYRFSPELQLEQEITGLNTPVSSAVDAAGHIFVAQIDDSILEFNSLGEPVDATGKRDSANTIIGGAGYLYTSGLTSDSSGDLFIATEKGTIRYTLSAGSYQRSEPLIDPALARGITLTPSGDVLLDLGSELVEREPSGGLLARGGSEVIQQGRNLAISSSTDVIYVADGGANAVDLIEKGPAPEVPVTEGSHATGPVSFLLRGTLAGEVTAYHFDYSTGEACENGMATPSIPSNGGAVQVEVTGLEPSSSYTYCLVATGEFGSTVGPPKSLVTGSLPPLIGAAQFSSATAHSVVVDATLSPNNLPGSYHFEYTTGGETKTTGVVSYLAGPIFTASAKLEGLVAGAQYSVRLVARNSVNESKSGAEGSFATLASGTSALPDGRVFEMVSPAENGNANVAAPYVVGTENSQSQGVQVFGLFQPAADGSAISYEARLVFGGANGFSGFIAPQFLATRSSAGGWSQQSIQPYGYRGSSYQGFTPNLTAGVINAGGGFESEPLPPLTPEALGGHYMVLYIRNDKTGSYTPLYTNVARPSRQPEGEGVLHFGSKGVSEEGSSIFGQSEDWPLFVGGSVDYSHMLFQANDDLLAGNGGLENELRQDVNTEISKGEEANYLYDDSNGHLTIVDISPGGKVIPNATFGSTPFVREGTFDFSNVISEDGSRVYWTDLTSGIVYLSEDGSSTVQVSAGSARYWTASNDGRHALYTENGGLYRFDAAPGQGGQVREAIMPNSADVMGVVGASKDTSTVYFLAGGVLSGTPSGEGKSPVEGEPNLYVSHGGGVPVFIATLNPSDLHEMPPFGANAGDLESGLGDRTIHVTGDGGSIVFMSQSPLGVAGFPEGYPLAGERAAEVYVYQTTSNTLYCASCGSTGVSGPSGYLPVSWSSTYLPQWISEDGNRVFFDGDGMLTAQATNGRQNVYEWEREGHGSCVHGDGSTGGCVFLLSGGTSEADSWFVGASANGDDAFIVTRAQLTPEDENDTFDLYDARVDGIKPAEPPACTGSGCQGPPAPPPFFATPPSVTYNGVGNFPAASVSTGVGHKSKSLTRAEKLADALKPCRKEHKLTRRHECEALARKRYGADVGRKSIAVGRRKHA